MSEKIRLKKGQVNPNNPHATSIAGPAKLNIADASNINIPSRNKSNAQAPTVTMSLKNPVTGKTSEYQVIDSRLTNESRPAQKDVLVRIEKDEARFMDMDKLTYALGYAVMGNGFSHKNILIYTPFTEDSGYKIYKVDID